MEAEKQNSIYHTGEQSPSPVPSKQIDTPTGWKYKKFKIGKKTVWYASPSVQLVLVSMVCFLCPGMFNAVSGIGGAGLSNPYVADNSNVALYSTFSVVGFFAGTVTNRLGVKATLSMGGFGYCIYIVAFLVYKHFPNDSGRDFAYFAGALLGVCAGLLWSAQGAVMMSYPTEKSKGRYISTFWAIFNLGAVVGGLIPLGENIDDTSSGTVSDGTYIGFICLTFFGALLALTSANAGDVIRSDGSKVIVMKHPSWKTEIMGMYQTFLLEPYVILLFPMFFASNWFYTYQFNSVNGAKFDVRTRALNSVLYWLAQIFGAGIFGIALDVNMRRRTKAFAVWGVLFALTMVVWGGGYSWQTQYTRAEAKAVDANGDPAPTTKIYDWTSTGYVGPMFLYFFYGFYDAAWQTTVYWLMGALTNNGRRLANYAGYYKGIQSAGAAIAYRVDAQNINYIAQFASCWGLCAGSLVLALPLLAIKIRDHTPIEEDLKFSDETYDDVAAQHERAGPAVVSGFERNEKDGR